MRWRAVAIRDTDGRPERGPALPAGTRSIRTGCHPGMMRRQIRSRHAVAGPMRNCGVDPAESIWLVEPPHGWRGLDRCRASSNAYACRSTICYECRAGSSTQHHAKIQPTSTAASKRYILEIRRAGT